MSNFLAHVHNTRTERGYFFWGSSSPVEWGQWGQALGTGGGSFQDKFRPVGIGWEMVVCFVFTRVYSGPECVENNSGKGEKAHKMNKVLCLILLSESALLTDGRKL